MEKFILGIRYLVNALLFCFAALVLLFFIAVVWQAGHQADVARAHSEGRTCGEWVC